MPIPFYNTGAPTPTTKNTINSVTVTYGIRDFLLNSNLGLDGGFYPQLTMSINGGPLIGEPVLDTSINGNTNVIPDGYPISGPIGLFRYDIAIIPNQFKNDNPNSPQYIYIEDIPTIQGMFGTVDFPQGIQQYPSSPTIEVSQYGLLGKSEYAQFRASSTLRNLYVDSTKQVDAGDWISLQPAGFSQQITGYLDEYGALNQGGGPDVQSADILGTLLLGQSFDLRASLAGRVLGAAGKLDDTKLGQIGAQQLSNALAYNAAFNVQQDILGAFNVQDNILALVKGDSLPGLRPNYKITVPSGILGKAFSYASSTLGFTLPSSQVSRGGSIFSSENQSGNIQRANSMLADTGKGQRKALIENVTANIYGSDDYDSPSDSAFRSGYVPGYAKGERKPELTPNLYAFVDDVTKGTVLNLFAQSDGLIPDLSWNRSEMIKKYGFLAPEDTGSGPKGNSGYDNRKINDVGFTWTSTDGEAVNSEVTSNSAAFADELPLGEIEGLHPKKSILSKTQKLFNRRGMLNIVTAKGDMNKNSSQIETANGGGFSKGSAVISGYRYTEDGIFDGEKMGAENTYCRSWTTVDRYDTLYNLIRHRPLDGEAVYPYRHKIDNSVLDDNGFAKIAPYKTDSSDIDIKKYMLSIENLAWFDNYKGLIPCEQGPGDLLTGKKGRIMWFPPYNIQFNENSSVSWEKTDFIGRGESVYTYNNTERSGTLSFQIIVDHPSYSNAFAGSNGPDDNYVASFFAGCVEPNEYFRDKLTPYEIQTITIEEAQPDQIVKPVEKIPPPPFSFYFPNDVDTLQYDKYENQQTGSSATALIDYTTNPEGAGGGIGVYKGTRTAGTKSGINGGTGYTDNFNHGLNYYPKKPSLSPFKVNDKDVFGSADPNLIPYLKEHITSKCSSCEVTVTGYASRQGSVRVNKDTLSINRANTVIEFLKNAGIFDGLGLTKDEISARFLPGETDEISTNTSCPKTKGSQTDFLSCKQDRRAGVTFKSNPKYLTKEEASPAPIKVSSIKKTVTNNIKRRFYSECSYFEKLTETDKFVFDSFRQKIRYFHPAFHSTTPEGLNSRLTFLQQCTRQGPTFDKQGADNLSFGRPPVCILRVGDFYNTKIIIDTLSIDYEPIVWDLNPEGVGVQPMIANVSLSFKFIGGSTLMGPINKLQNALSFNYYANTHVYDPRADYISKDKPIIKVKGEKDKVVPNSKYYIHNTVNDLFNGSAVEYNEQNITSSESVTPTTDQTVAAATPNATQQAPIVDSFNDDLQKIKILSCEDTVDAIELFVGLTEPLTQEYSIKVSFLSSNPENPGTPSSNEDFDSENYKLEVDSLYQLFEFQNYQFSPYPTMKDDLTIDYTTVKLWIVREASGSLDRKTGYVQGNITKYKPCADC